MKQETTQGRKFGSKNYFQKCLGLPKSYQFYSKHLTWRQQGLIKKKLYCQILKLANQKIMKRIIEDSVEFIIPYGLGRLRVRKKKMTRIVTSLVNWVETKKQGKKVYWINEHSDGYLMKFYWDKYLAAISNISLYKFVATKSNRQHLSATIRKTNVDYFE